LIPNLDSPAAHENLQEHQNSRNTAPSEFISRHII
jgi:hypothetical protein